MTMIMSQSERRVRRRVGKFHIIKALHTHEVNKSKIIDKLQSFHFFLQLPEKRLDS